MVEFQDSRAPATAMVTGFEQTLPAPLPDDYRSFLLEQNGGYLAPNWWPPEQRPGSAVDALYGLGAVADMDSLVATREVFEGRIPGDLLAIGYDGLGGQACVRLTATTEAASGSTTRSTSSTRTSQRYLS